MSIKDRLKSIVINESTLAVPPAAPLETKFPPARPAMLSDMRTAPGRMLAASNERRDFESQINALKQELDAYIGSQPVRKLSADCITPSRLANRHEAAFKTASFLKLKDDITISKGNVQPILVRPKAGMEGQYEIVFGHRRHRACLEAGQLVNAVIGDKDLADVDLFLLMDHENRSRTDLSPYEQGVMYNKAMELGLVGDVSNRDIAKALGVSHTWINNTRKVASLPQAILDCFRSPLEIKCPQGVVLDKALQEDQKGLLRRAEKLRGKDLPSAEVVAKLLARKDAKLHG